MDQMTIEQALQILVELANEVPLKAVPANARVAAIQAVSRHMADLADQRVRDAMRDKP